MRDPERINRIINLLRQYWFTYPDLRLCQIIGNTVNMNDPYYLEDDTFEDMLRKEIEKSRASTR